MNVCSIYLLNKAAVEEQEENKKKIEEKVSWRYITQLED